jgi:hypothetical protein
MIARLFPLSLRLLLRLEAFSGKDQGEPEAWVSVVIFGAALAIEKAQTIYHAKHYVNEYIPEDEKFVPLTAPA